MEQYIKKSALVAEIEKKIRTEQGYSSGDEECGYRDCAKEILSFLDTLEVKEVDLEKEFDDYTKDILACDVQFEPFTHLYNCAKHFFELGLKAKGE